ncbi:metalloregulator ArsR/SmtB family transcription factor [Lysobacter enzymogenes]|uniref:ArsR family transcriptional regulator n=1 Tax=Lysobacter enzymogenes TaxID=69 RepID=A0A3N2RCN8_LYSEN|nr:metalloregulator ArsR/SmtB family transcription factor [Lysobacter enzymogenes]ROU05169.1 ArsR family transcriptional regulator [Lysobacter enzymogenes]
MSQDKIFEALASRPRRQILAFLSERELSAGDIAARFDMSAPAVSRHLSVLVNAGLISSERRGQFVVYKLVPDHLVNTLTQFAFEICPVGGPLKRESRRAARKSAGGKPAG